jgi:tRNA modification GTPase
VAFNHSQSHPPTQLDTIVAISSPPGQALRGLIRLSGPNAIEVAQSFVTKPLDTPRVLSAARFELGPNTSLPILISIFKAPASYTGQDMVELQCPGHPAVLERMIHLLLSSHTRLAEPGEFTFRAYLAGKLDLTQAEGINATISATSDSQLQAASLLTRGQLGQLANASVDQLGTLLALVEAGIDFTDQDDVIAITPKQLFYGLKQLTDTISNLLANSRSWGAIDAIPRVVLVGKPSAGKSTLFNALLGKSRAVMSPVSGTTRDVLEEPMTFIFNQQEVEVMLVDIAGLDLLDHTKSKDTQSHLDQEARLQSVANSSASKYDLEKEIQDNARNAINSADLVLMIHDTNNDANSKTHMTRFEQLHIRTTAPILHVKNKADLQSSCTNAASDSNIFDIEVSGQTGLGLSELKALIAEHIGNRAVSLAADMLALQPRHHAAITAARSELQDATDMVKSQITLPALVDIELVAGTLRNALDHLAGLGGTLTPDDVIGRVFASFCVGK